MTARSDAYAALGAAAEQLPLVRISPLSPTEVSAQLRHAGSAARGLRQAAAQDDELAMALDTPLFLKAGLRAFRGRRTRAILDVRRTDGWDNAILVELVRLVLREQAIPVVKPEPLLHYLAWVAKVFAAAEVTSFYGFVPPRRLLDEANRHPRVNGLRTAAAVLAGALSAAVAGWLLVGPRTGIGAAVLGAASVYLLTRATTARMDLEMAENKDTVTWSLSALRAAAPGLGARLAAAMALAGLVQFAASNEIDHALRLGDMTSATAIHTRLYVAAFLVVLLVSYMRRAAAKVGRIVDPDDPVAMDLPMDNRKTPRAWWLRLPDLSVAFWSAGLFLLPALIWATCYQLLASLGPAHLRYGTVQTAFHWLLRLMDFPARSPLHLQAGPVWIVVVAAIGFGVGVAFTWAVDLYTADWARATTAACERDAGQPDNDMIDLLDYGVQLSLLRRVEGRYSFYHPRLLEFFSGEGPAL